MKSPAPRSTLARTFAFSFVSLALTLGTGLGCSLSSERASARDRAAGAPRFAAAAATVARDWTAHPAIADVAPTSDIYAMSDIHGGYERAVGLLVANGLVASVPSSASSATWAGRDAVLVVAGDMIDKGPQPVEVIDLLRTLETGARADGGRVVVTFGNHETKFIANPDRSKATDEEGFTTILGAMGIDAHDVASGKEPRGAWLRDLPFGARVGNWFFSHAGDTHGRTVGELETLFRDAVDTNGFDDPNISGDDSILNSREWFAADETIGARYAKALGVGHIVFGHDRKVLGERNAIGTAQKGALFRIDCGMSPSVDDSEGTLLHVRRVAGEEIAEEIDATGGVRELWRGPAP